MVCILMAMPLVLIAVALGYLAKKLLQLKKQNSEDILKGSFIPFCLFLILSFTETQLTRNDKFIVEVKSEIILTHPWKFMKRLNLWILSRQKNLS